MTWGTAKTQEGRLLTGRALLDTLSDRERVFRSGTWTRANVRGAGYDLTLATDLMVVPLAPGADQFKPYERGQRRLDDIILAPGDTALVSTQERFSLNFDLAGNVGPKFSLAARGLLILTGVAVDPGYGRSRDRAGRWLPMEDQRLHFIVANVGPHDIALRPGHEKLAFLQLFTVGGGVVRSQTASVGFEVLQSQLFASSSNNATGGLAYFRNVRDLARRIDTIEVETKRVSDSVDKVEKASEYVVVFGVFLVATTILGVLAAFLFQAVTNLPADLTSAESIAGLSVAGVYVLSIATLVIFSISRIRK